jgi:dihydrofolate reductase
MGALITHMAMSLDGYVADENDGIDELFGWYFSGDVAVPTAKEGVSFQTDEKSAEVLRGALTGNGALITGRRQFDMTNGWDGHHPMGVPTVVITHSIPEGWPREDSSMHFVTDGIESALEKARALAGDRDVVVSTPNIAQQYLNAGLLDRIAVSLVPVLLGAGVPFFENLSGAPVRLGTPSVTEGSGVTHLTYDVDRTGTR